MVIADNHITTSLAATGEIITEHYIDTARDYLGSVFDKGPHPHQRCRALAVPVAVTD